MHAYKAGDNYWFNMVGMDMESMAQRVRNRLLIEEHLTKDEVILMSILHMAAIMRLKYTMTRYKRIYRIDKDLLKVAKETSIDKLSLSDIKLPLENTILWLPEPKEMLGRVICAIMLRHIIPGSGLNEEETMAKKAMTESYIGKYPGGKSYIDAACDKWQCQDDFSKVELFEAFLFGYYPNDGSASISMLRLTNENGELRFDKVRDATINRVRGMQGEDGVKLAVSGMNILYDILSYIALINSVDVKINSKHAVPRKKASDKVKSGAFDECTPEWVGETPLVKVLQLFNRDVKEHQGGTVAPHWRRAHWHTVLYGPKKTQRRLKWFGQTTVGFKEKKKGENGRQDEKDLTETV